MKNVSFYNVLRCIIWLKFACSIVYFFTYISIYVDGLLEWLLENTAVLSAFGWIIYADAFDSTFCLLLCVSTLIIWSLSVLASFIPKKYRWGRMAFLLTSGIALAMELAYAVTVMFVTYDVDNLPSVFWHALSLFICITAVFLVWRERKHKHTTAICE